MRSMWFLTPEMALAAGETRSLLGPDAPGAAPPELTVRAVAAGAAVGALLCASNMYFGLQTGWVTMGSLQSALLGFGLFRAATSATTASPLTPRENVILQTTAVSTATLPLAGGFVGILPALGMLEVTPIEWSNRAEQDSSGPVEWSNRSGTMIGATNDAQGCLADQQSSRSERSSGTHEDAAKESSRSLRHHSARIPRHTRIRSC